MGSAYAKDFLAWSVVLNFEFPISKIMKKGPVIIGITGPIGSGKSTAAAQFARLGCALINADKLNHEILTQPQVIERISRWWGPDLLNAEGKIDREALGSIVFADEAALKQLTDLVHPLIAQREKELIRAYQQDPAIAAVVLDVPLLFESGQDKWCDFVIFIQSEAHLRLERLKNRRWSAEKIKKIKKWGNFQLALDKKAKMSDHILRNNSGICDLTKQVVELYSKILEIKRSR